MKGQLIFIDTGAFYAKYVANDQYHQTALKKWNKISKEKLKCISSNFVLSEFITLLIYRFGAKNALKAAREIYASNFLTIIQVSREIEMSALDWLDRFSDQDFSMTDATSFALMQVHKISRAFSFDKHYKIAGFEVY